MLRRGVADHARDAHPRRVDEHVQAAVRLEMGRHEAGAVLLVLNVRSDRRRAELGRRFLEALELARGEREGVAFVAEHASDREADARRAPGDERARHGAILSQTKAARRPAASAEQGEVEGGDPLRLPSSTRLPSRFLLPPTGIVWREPSLHSQGDAADADEPRQGRRVRGEVLGRAARGAARRARPGRRGRPARRPRPGGRRGGLPTRRRHRAGVHGRFLPAGRRRPADVRTDRRDERAQRRVRDGRTAAARAVGHRVPGGAPHRDAGRGARRRRRGDPRGRRDPRRGPHDPRRRAEVRARGRRHRAPAGRVAKERRAARRRGAAHQAARHGPRPPGGARRPCAGRRARSRDRGDDGAESGSGRRTALVRAERRHRRHRLRAARPCPRDGAPLRGPHRPRRGGAPGAARRRRAGRGRGAHRRGSEEPRVRRASTCGARPRRSSKRWHTTPRRPGGCSSRFPRTSAWCWRRRSPRQASQCTRSAGSSRGAASRSHERPGAPPRAGLAAPLPPPVRRRRRDARPRGRIGRVRAPDGVRARLRQLAEVRLDAVPRQGLPRDRRVREPRRRRGRDPRVARGVACLPTCRRAAAVGAPHGARGLPRHRGPDPPRRPHRDPRPPPAGRDVPLPARARRRRAVDPGRLRGVEPRRRPGGAGRAPLAAPARGRRASLHAP